ncbi:MAG TPA: hypothetical protein VHS09_03830, partial [Polyangiaceae bacterium]|nr:hypothetical protein [Polyangiaceae bacterium]
MDPVGLARVVARGAGAAGVVLLLLAPPPARAAEADAPLRIVLWADRDDDDANGQPDGEQHVLPVPTHVDFVPLDKRLVGAVLQVVSGGEHARVVLGKDGVFPWGRAVPELGWLEGLSPGRVELVAKTPGHRLPVTIDVRGIDLRDGTGAPVDMARSHASLERTPPARIEGPPDAPYDDPDALRVVVALPDDGPGLDGEREIAIESVSVLGARVDAVP